MLAFIIIIGKMCLGEAELIKIAQGREGDARSKKINQSSMLYIFIIIGKYLYKLKK